MTDQSLTSTPGYGSDPALLHMHQTPTGHGAATHEKSHGDEIVLASV